MSEPKPTIATLHERVSALEEQGPVETDPVLDEHKAFLAWQKRMPNIAKARAGHKYKYVGLSELLSAVLPVLTELGFSLYHETDCGPDGQTLRVTCFLRFGPTTARTSSLSIPMDQVVRAGQGMNVVQAMGSFITYARRYTTMCVLGITDGVDTGRGRPERTRERLGPRTRRRERVRMTSWWPTCAVRSRPRRPWTRRGSGTRRP